MTIPDSATETFAGAATVHWRIVLGPPGAPEYWPLAENTSANQVAHLLREAQRTWPDAYAEARPIGRWAQRSPFERAPCAPQASASDGNAANAGVCYDPVCARPQGPYGWCRGHRCGDTVEVVSQLHPLTKRRWCELRAGHDGVWHDDGVVSWPVEPAALPVAPKTHDVLVQEDVDSVRGPGWYVAECYTCDWRTSGLESVVEQAVYDHEAEPPRA